MSVILDVGQPYSDASIELCRIFNTALSEIGLSINLQMVPNDEPNKTMSWLIGSKIGYAAEVQYTDNTISISCFEFDELAHSLSPSFKEIIHLSDFDSLSKIGHCLQKFSDYETKNLA
jgi:hypothetical protein